MHVTHELLSAYDIIKEKARVLVMDKGFFKSIYEIVKRIPKGKVATYKY